MQQQSQRSDKKETAIQVTTYWAHGKSLDTRWESQLRLSFAPTIRLPPLVTHSSFLMHQRIRQRVQFLVDNLQALANTQNTNGRKDTKTTDNYHTRTLKR